MIFYMIFSLWTIRPEYTLFQTRKIIFNTNLIEQEERETDFRAKKKEKCFYYIRKYFKSYKVRHLCPYFQYFISFGYKQKWINTKTKRKMYFSVKKTHSNVWETFSTVLKGYFHFVAVSSRRKPGIKTK